MKNHVKGLFKYTKAWSEKKTKKKTNKHIHMAKRLNEVPYLYPFVRVCNFTSIVRLPPLSPLQRCVRFCAAKFPQNKSKTFTPLDATFKASVKCKIQKENFLKKTVNRK